MSGTVDAINFAQAWDFVLIGGVANPGICQVSEFKRKHTWDIKKGKGVRGAAITYVGEEPAKGTIKFLLWQPIHFVQWDLFRPSFKYDPSKKAVQAVDIYHPALADVDITSVVVEQIGNIVHDGEGLYSITVDFLEYFPPPNKPAVGTPTGAQQYIDVADKVGGQPPAADDALQAQIAALMAQAQAP